MNDREREESDHISDEALEEWLSKAQPLPSSHAFQEKVMRDITSRPNPHRKALSRPRPWYRRFGVWLARGPSFPPIPWRSLGVAVATFVMGFGLATFILFDRPGMAPGSLAAVTANAPAERVMVSFRFHAPAAKQVAVVGDFNYWQTRYPMYKNADGTWVATIPLPPGDYEYMFVRDVNQWVKDPNASRYRQDGFGGQTAVLSVSPSAI